METMNAEKTEQMEIGAVESGGTPENIENKGTAVATEGVATEGAEQPQDNKPVQEDTSKEALTPEEQEIIDTWDKDKRYATSWKKDPNRLYKSYRDMEKVYPQYKKQIETFKNTFSKYGIDESKLEDYIKEYIDIKNPDRYENQVSSYVMNWLSNPMYKNDIVSFFETLEKQDLQRKYGANLPDEVLNKIAELDRYKTEKEQEEYKRRNDEYYNSRVSTLNEQVELNKKFAEKYGIDYDDDTQRKLIEYCRDNNIAPDMVHDKFIRFAMPQVEKAITDRSEQNAIKRYNEKRQKGVLAEGTPKAPEAQPVKSSFRDSMSKVLGFKI